MADILPYLNEKSSDFDEILYTAADFELDERDQKWKSCIGQTPSSTERIFCYYYYYYYRYHCDEMWFNKNTLRESCNLLSPVHTGDKVEFNTVDFIASWLCHFGPVHTGDRVDRIGDSRIQVFVICC